MNRSCPGVVRVPIALVLNGRPGERESHSTLNTHYTVFYYYILNCRPVIIFQALSPHNITDSQDTRPEYSSFPL